MGIPVIRKENSKKCYESIYTEDGILVGSKPSHFEKLETIIPNNPNIKNAVDYDFSRYYFSKKVQKDYQ